MAAIPFTGGVNVFSQLPMQALESGVFILTAEMTSETWDTKGQLAYTAPYSAPNPELARAGHARASAGPSSGTNLSQGPIN